MRIKRLKHYIVIKVTFHLLCRVYLVVHKLRPADIKVVAALGDSSTVSAVTQ